ncbi:MAG: asparagine synthase (glutamine-hydrolyzing), partial [Bacteroidota bacterium]
MSDPAATLRKMADAQAHRGPDAADVFLSEDRRLGLAHRRLSILDTSHAADQPMRSHDGNSVICYNGEVFNFRELAKRIEVPLKTTGDTEVLLEGIAQHGPEFMNEANGMFAIAQYDQQKRELLLIRDRIGIKPLYIAEREEGLYFASELKALKAVLPNLNLDPEAIELYLQVGFIPHPYTIYQGVQVFPTGHMATYSPERGLQLEPYWQLTERVPQQPQRFNSEKALIDKLDELVQAAVQRRLIADVPLGAFLSGGIDSSLVTAIAQHHTDQPLQTFSIGFEDKKFNELHYAEAVSKHLKTDQHSFLLKETQALEQIDKILDVYDQPYASGSAIPTLLVSEMARKHVTVALSGDGGDESFLGYGAYLWARRLSKPLVELTRRPMSGILKAS